MNEKDIFESTDERKNTSEVFKFSVVRNIYSAICLLCLDIFESRYEIFMLPRSFTPSGKASLQRALKDFKYSYLQALDKNYLVSVLNRYEQDQGKKATLELLDWIRNATDNSAAGMERLLSNLHTEIIRKEIKPKKIPLRIERYFSFRELLRDSYLASDGTKELDPSWFESEWDQHFYKLQAYDYYGKMEITFDPSLTAFVYANTLYGQIAWENACQGGPPDVTETVEISNWLATHSGSYLESGFTVNDLCISPLLRSEYISRSIIKE